MSKVSLIASAWHHDNRQEVSRMEQVHRAIHEAVLEAGPKQLAHLIRTVTQVLENIAFRSDISSDTVVLTDFCKLLTTSLRDGCDVMDVIGRRLRAQVAE